MSDEVSYWKVTKKSQNKKKKIIRTIDYPDPEFDCFFLLMLQPRTLNFFSFTLGVNYFRGK